MKVRAPAMRRADADPHGAVLGLHRHDGALGERVGRRHSMISVCGVMGYTPLQHPRASRLASPAAASMAPAAWFPVTSARGIAAPSSDRFCEQDSARARRGAQPASLAVVVVGLGRTALGALHHAFRAVDEAQVAAGARAAGEAALGLGHDGVVAGPLGKTATHLREVATAEARGEERDRLREDAGKRPEMDGLGAGERGARPPASVASSGCSTASASASVSPAEPASAAWMAKAARRPPPMAAATVPSPPARSPQT